MEMYFLFLAQALAWGLVTCVFASMQGCHALYACKYTCGQSQGAHDLCMFTLTCSYLYFLGMKNGNSMQSMNFSGLEAMYLLVQCHPEFSKYSLVPTFYDRYSVADREMLGVR